MNAAKSVSSSLSTLPRRSVGDLSVAVVGYGSIGRRHLENLARLGVGQRWLVRRPVAPNPAFPPPSVPVVHSADEALARGVDVAIVANPTRFHVETARAWLSSGVAVLVEKPLSDNLAEAERFCRDAAGNAPLCGMAYCLRYHPAYALARTALEQGRIGLPLYAKAWFESYLPEWHPWEDYRESYAARRELGGGVLPTLDHEIDFLAWCFGPPEQAAGWLHGTGALGIEVPDHASLLMTHPGGVRSSVELSLCRLDRRRGFELVGDQASLRFTLEEGVLRLCVGASAADEVLWDGRCYDLNDMYLELLADFLRAVADGAPHAPIPVEAGLPSLAVLAAVENSRPAPLRPVTGSCTS